MRAAFESDDVDLQVRLVQESGAIPGAIHIPMKQIEKRMHELPKNAEIVFY